MTTTTNRAEADATRRLEEAARRADVLRAVVESINGDLALEPLLGRVIESAVAVLGAGYGAIGLLFETAEGPLIRTAALCNLPPSEGQRRIAPGVGLAGRIIQEQRPLRLDRYADLGELVRDDILDHAVLGVPIWWGGRVIGHIGVGAPPPQRFDEEDEATLALFAQHVAIAIRIARQFEQERRRTERTAVINRIGGLITGSLSLDRILDTAVRALADHLQQHTVAVMLTDPDDPETLVLRARGGVYIDSNLGDYRQSIHHGFAGAAARARRLLIVNDVRADPRYISVVGGDALAAELAAPLVMGDRLLGLLNIESERPFSPEDAADFEIIAAQLASASEHARLFGETEAALEETRLLFETSRRISLALDVDAVVGAYLDGVAARHRFACTVALLERGEDETPIAVIVRGRWSWRDGLQVGQTRLPHSRDAYDADLDQGRTIVIEDYRTDPRVSETFREVQVRRGSAPALAMIPLMAAGRRIGLVILSSPAPRPWDDADLRPYQVTAVQLAAAIDNRRQHELLAERERRLAVLEERNRLARDLYDAVTQSIFSVSLIAQSIMPAVRRDPAEAERRIDRLVEQSRTAMRELRAVLAELRPDVILMDLVLPDIDGVEGTRRIVDGGAASRIVILTSFADDVRVRDAIQAGAIGYLLKDVVREDLLKAIRGAARGEPALHPEAQKYLMRQVAGPRERSPLQHLTDRERDVLRLIGEGRGNKEITAMLKLTEGTVKGYVSAVLAKVGVADRTHAALLAVRHGLAAG